MSGARKILAATALTQPMKAAVNRCYGSPDVPTGIYVLAGDTDKGRWLGPLVNLGKTLIVAKFVKQKWVPFFANLDQADLLVLADMMHNGRLKPVIDRRYSLDQVADAIRDQYTGHARGKVIVTVTP